MSPDQRCAERSIRLCSASHLFRWRRPLQLMPCHEFVPKWGQPACFQKNPWGGKFPRGCTLTTRAGPWGPARPPAPARGRARARPRVTRARTHARPPAGCRVHARARSARCDRCISSAYSPCPAHLPTPLPLPRGGGGARSVAPAGPVHAPLRPPPSSAPRGHRRKSMLCLAM